MAYFPHQNVNLAVGVNDHPFSDNSRGKEQGCSQGMAAHRPLAHLRFRVRHLVFREYWWHKTVYIHV